MEAKDMNKEITSAAVKAILAGSKINIDKLVGYIMDSNPNDYLRIVTLLTDLTDPVTNIPQTSKVYGNNCTYESYNEYSNSIIFTYGVSTTLFFNNEENADTYAKTGKKEWGDYSREAVDEFTYEATHVFMETGEVSLGEWVEGAKI